MRPLWEEKVRQSLAWEGRGRKDKDAPPLTSSATLNDLPIALSTPHDPVLRVPHHLGQPPPLIPLPLPSLLLPQPTPACILPTFLPLPPPSLLRRSLPATKHPLLIHSRPPQGANNLLERKDAKGRGGGAGGAALRADEVFEAVGAGGEGGRGGGGGGTGGRRRGRWCGGGESSVGGVSARRGRDDSGGSGVDERYRLGGSGRSSAGGGKVL